jgi:hypothetical protein
MVRILAADYAGNVSFPAFPVPNTFALFVAPKTVFPVSSFLTKENSFSSE